MSTERNNQLIEQVVTRFDQDMDGEMEPEESGEWVRFEDIEELIELIRTDEREACVGLVDDMVRYVDGYKFEFDDEIVKETVRNVCGNLAKGIRARGNE